MSSDNTIDLPDPQDDGALDPSTLETHGWTVPSGDGPHGLKVRCPHCQLPLEIRDEDSLGSRTCPSCGSDFSLVDDPGAATSAQPAVRRVGQFELVEQLGVGSFGSVWKARDLALDRVVAVKLPRKDQLAPDEVEQFFREARAAAQLKHPNIVSVHEVGRDAGTVYIVSDLIRGMTLTDWLSGQLPDPVEAARICTQICTALAHAHARGVIHRDLKPGNVMLDDDGQPHIMDFGLAKREAGEATMTVEGRILGTPAYMSPEQARGEGHAVEGRTDIYSLGVMLYQLLTGELPFRGTPRMLLHQVLHDEPRSPRSLNDRIPRDLETICLKAMAKDPARRYDTAQAMADDLNRWLRGEVILARPVGRIERAARWVKRNRFVSALAAAVVLLLTLVAAGSTLAALSIRAARDQARYNEQQQRLAAQQARAAELKATQHLGRAIEAERATAKEAENAKRAAAFLASLFQSSDPLGLFGQSEAAVAKVGLQATALDMLKLATEQLQGAFEDRPLVRAQLLDTIGSVYASYGRLDDAEPLLRAGLDLRVREVGEQNGALVPSLQHLAMFHFLEGDYAAAESFGRRAVALSRADTRERRLERATSELVLGFVISLSHLTAYDKTPAQQAESESLLRSAIETRLNELGETHRDTLLAEAILVAALTARPAKRAEGAALAIKISKLLKHSPASKPFADFLESMQAGTVAGSLGQFEQARKIFEAELVHVQENFGKHHFLGDVLRDNLTWVYNSLGQPEEAEQLYRQAVENTLQQVGERPVAADRMWRLAEYLGFRGNTTERRAWLERALAIRRRHFDDQSSQIEQLRAALEANLMDQAHDARKQGKFEVAHELFGQAAARFAELGETHDADQARALFWQANLARNAGRATESIPLFEKSHALFAASLGEQHVETARCEMDLGIALGSTGKLVDAGQRLEKAYRSLALTPKQDISLRGMCAQVLAVNLFQQHQTEPALAVYRQEIELLKSAAEGNGPALAKVQLVYATALAELSRYREAAEVLEQCRQQAPAASEQVVADVARWYLTLIYRVLGEPELQRAVCQEFVASLDDKGEATSQHLAAWSAAITPGLSQADAQRAVDLVRRAAAAQPQEAGHRTLVALAFDRAGAYDEALASLAEFKGAGGWTAALAAALAHAQLRDATAARERLAQFEDLCRQARLKPFDWNIARIAPHSWDQRLVAGLLYHEVQQALRDASPPVDTSAWPVLFHDDFVADAIDPAWKPVLGKWEVREGALLGRSSPQPSLGLMLGNIRLRQLELPDTVEVRCRVRHQANMAFMMALQDRNLTQGQIVALSNTPDPLTHYQGIGVYEQHGPTYIPAYLDPRFHWTAQEASREVRLLRHDDQLELSVDGQWLATVGVHHVDHSFLLLQTAYSGADDALVIERVEIRAPSAAAAKPNAAP